MMQTRLLKRLQEKERWQLYHLYEQYRKIYEYFDDWIVIKSDNTYTDIEKIISRKKENKHMETIQWNQE